MAPLIELRSLTRTFSVGDDVVSALKSVDLRIERGEFVALVGASGSGKSTLLSILGCLDSVSSGNYFFDGTDVNNLQDSRLAELRRRQFGFVFQRYHLLDALTAVENVEVPAIYNGFSKSERHQRARSLLSELGLKDRFNHRPNELSGGQQQRVSIARALMNGGQIILADEPTGALDSASGRQVLEIMRGLHQRGHTIILVTHDDAVAKHASRIVELKDGSIVADYLTASSSDAGADVGKGVSSPSISGSAPSGGLKAALSRAAASFKIALTSVVSHKLRSILTLFGIVVGIVSVIAVVGLGEGGQKAVLEQINSLEPNTISIFPGSGFGDRNASSVDTLSPQDAEALGAQSYVDKVSPLVRDDGKVSYRNIQIDGLISGVTNDFFELSQRKIRLGSRFTSSNSDVPLQEVVIDNNARDALFGDGHNPVGETLVLKERPFVIVGVISELSGSLGDDRRPQFYVPYASSFVRISGTPRLSEIVVRVNSEINAVDAESAMAALLEKRHGTRDFFTFNSDKIRRTIEKTTQMFSILVVSIAAIALLVGGVGVMNIMLVSVAERTGEIGLRLAVGARQSDIRQQFVTEALVITGVGSAAGVALSYCLEALASLVEMPIPLTISPKSVAVGCVMALSIGIIFGFFPARRASKINPVEALAKA